MSDGPVLLRHAPAVHTRNRKEMEWQVVLCDIGPVLVITHKSGRRDDIVMSADAANRMGGALHAAAQEYQRMEVLRKGEHLGRL